MHTERENLRGVVFVAVRYLARVLLAAGMNAREFVELSKLAFVDAASDRAATPGRDAPTTEVARQTGLTRAEVKRLRDKAADNPLPERRFRPTTVP